MVVTIKDKVKKIINSNIVHNTTGKSIERMSQELQEHHLQENTWSWLWARSKLWLKSRPRLTRLYHLKHLLVPPMHHLWLPPVASVNADQSRTCYFAQHGGGPPSSTTYMSATFQQQPKTFYMASDGKFIVIETQVIRRLCQPNSMQVWYGIRLQLHKTYLHQQFLFAWYYTMAKIQLRWNLRIIMMKWRWHLLFMKNMNMKTLKRKITLNCLK